MVQVAAASNNKIALIALLCFVTLLGCSTAGTSSGAPNKHKIILVSIDGLRPEFYLDSQYPTPNLQELAKKGASAQGVIPAYPSMTFPNHASLVTGATSGKHGIYSNTIFTRETGPTKDWYFDVKYLKAQALWDAAKDAGRSVGILGWPVSLGARSDWIVPEVFSIYGIDHVENWKETTKFTDPKLLQELTPPVVSSNNDYDRWMTQSTSYLLIKYHPDLLFVHLRSLDEVQHKGGRETKELNQTLQFIDQMIGDLRNNISDDSTLLAITGDHGFQNAKRAVNPNVLFRKKGWLTLKEDKLDTWKVIAQGNDGQAYVYLKDPSTAATLGPEVLKVLKKEAPHNYTVLDAETLKRVGGDTNALCALDPLPGVALQLGVSKKHTLYDTLAHVKGLHGALAEKEPNLHTGLILMGPTSAIQPGVNLGTIRLTQIAPTLSSWLGLRLKDSQDSPLLIFDNH